MNLFKLTNYFVCAHVEFIHIIGIILGKENDHASFINKLIKINIHMYVFLSHNLELLFNYACQANMGVYCPSTRK